MCGIFCGLFFFPFPVCTNMRMTQPKFISSVNNRLNRGFRQQTVMLVHDFLCLLSKAPRRKCLLSLDFDGPNFTFFSLFVQERQKTNLQFCTKNTNLPCVFGSCVRIIVTQCIVNYNYDICAITDLRILCEMGTWWVSCTLDLQHTTSFFLIC